MQETPQIFRGAKNLFRPSLGFCTKGRHHNYKNVSIRALPEFGGGGLPLPEFFCALFLLKEKVSSMVATAEKVGKVARIGGWGGGLANSGNARIETFFLF